MRKHITAQGVSDMNEKLVDEKGEVNFPDPPFVRTLFSTTRFAWLWLIIRLYLGYRWITSGYGKLTNPAWMQGGEALRGFWEGAVAIPENGRPAIAFGWYRTFLQTMLDAQSYEWFGPLVAVGEVVIGVLLLLGAFTGIAATIGGFMNFNFMLAGSASVNPVFFLLQVLLILAWKVAGWYGLDRWLLPRLGTPWYRGTAWARPDDGPTMSSPRKS
jgi:thiosulfate dehydrogenase [quinone] large subunit